MRISLFTYFVSFYSLAEDVNYNITYPAGLFEMEQRRAGDLLTPEEVTITLLDPGLCPVSPEHFHLTAITTRAGKVCSLE